MYFDAPAFYPAIEDDLSGDNNDDVSSDASDQKRKVKKMRMRYYVLRLEVGALLGIHKRKM